ncbi:MAG: fatty acid desaturase family protein [Acidobacteria bacterium]|nr:fatty acid desaturase family protein [Acidobacteriota bacterium]
MGVFLQLSKSQSRSTSAGSPGGDNHTPDVFDVGPAAPAGPLPRAGAGDASHGLHGLLERGATILAPLLFAPALLLSYQRLSQAEAGWLAVPGVLLGLAFGDFVTGLVHWAADTYCGEDTPVIGRGLVRPFRVHHVRPLEICDHGLVETVGNTCILAAPLLALFLALAAYGETSPASAFAVFTAIMTVGVTVATNQFHKWAHQENPPPLARALQRAGIILSPEHHREHHAAPFESSYAITNGWLNPLLNRTGFFRRLEGALRAVGVKPYREERAAGSGK